MNQLTPEQLGTVVRVAVEEACTPLKRQIQLLSNQVDSVHGRLDDGDKRMSAQADELAANSAVTNSVRDILDAGKKGLIFLGWIGAALRWAAPVGIAALGLWRAFKGDKAS